MVVKLQRSVRRCQTRAGSDPKCKQTQATMSTRADSRIIKFGHMSISPNLRACIKDRPGSSQIEILADRSPVRSQTSTLVEYGLRINRVTRNSDQKVTTCQDPSGPLQVKNYPKMLKMTRQPSNGPIIAGISYWRTVATKRREERCTCQGLACLWKWN